MSSYDLPETEAERLDTLAAMGFLCGRFYAPDQWAAIIRSDPHFLIVEGDRDAFPFGYRRSWQYASYSEAKRNIERWDGVGQPDGWKSAYLGDVLTVWP